MGKKRKLISLKAITITTLAIWFTLSGFTLNTEGELPLREEIRKYISENVLPVISEQRIKLDEYLSLDEKKQIREFQEELRGFLNARRILFQDRPFVRPSDISDEERQEWMAGRRSRMQMHHKIMLEVFSIAERHEDEINRLIEPIEDKIPAWRDDIHNIIAESGEQDGWPGGRGWYFRGRYGGSGSGPGGPGVGPGRYGVGPGGAWGTGLPGQLGFMLSLHPEWFLLMNPESIDDILNSDLGALPLLSPNPTNGMVRINLEIDDPENVSIMLYDRQGTQIKDLLNKTLKKGNHELVFDVSDLSEGIYIYQIKTNENIQKGRIIIE